MSVFRLITITLSLTFFVACGGGGGGGGVAGGGAGGGGGGGGGGMPPPPDLEDLPAELVSASAARTATGGGNLPDTPENIKTTLESRADGADMLLFSNIYNLSATTEIDYRTTCQDGSCSAVINDAANEADQHTINFSLDNLGDAPQFDGGLEDLVRYNEEFQPVMSHRNVSLVQARSAGSSSDETFHFQSYGGWLENSGFAVMVLRGIATDNSRLLASYSFGQNNTTRPSPVGTETNTATWEGVMVGAKHIPTDFYVVQGDAEITVNFGTTPNVDVMFTDIENLSGGSSTTPPTTIGWMNLPLTGGGFMQDDNTNNRSIEGRFYGGHEEVGGVFDSNDIVGAFGARRQPPQ